MTQKLIKDCLDDSKGNIDHLDASKKVIHVSKRDVGYGLLNVKITSKNPIVHKQGREGGNDCLLKSG